MRIDVVSIFPEYLAPLDLSLVGKARTSGLLDLRVHDLRDWTTDRHRTVDDTPFGGGAGMVMRPDVWGTALDERARRRRAPAGADAVGRAVHAAHRRGAGRREPPGARVRSVRGDRRPRRRALPRAGRRVHRVLDRRLRAQRRRGGGARRRRGGRAAAARASSATRSRWSRSRTGRPGLLEYPVYTKPPAWAGLEVPEVLLSGHHARIARWRRDTALERTAARRPDLIAALPVDELDKHDLRAARRRSAGSPWTDGSRERDVAESPDLPRRARRCGRLARWCAQVASLPQGRRLTTTRALDPDAPDHQTTDAGPALHRAAETPSTTFLTCGRAGK